MPVTIVPKPTDAFIDKLSLTSPVPTEKHEEVVLNSEALVQDGYAKNGGYSSIYERSFECLVGGHKTKLYLQLEPRGKFIKTHNFLRVEFNANKANLGEVKQILDSLLPSGYQRIMKAGKVTNCEVATDINWLHMSQTIIHYPNFIKGSLHYSSDNIETINIGSCTSDNSVKAYDKTLQLIATGQPAKSGIYNDVTRVEFTLSGFNKPLEYLPNLPNPFEKLKIAAFPKHHLEHDFHLAAILALSSVVGYPCAIARAKKYNPHLAKQIEYKVLKNGIKGWWHPSDIWKGAQDSVDRLLYGESLEDTFSEQNYG